MLRQAKSLILSICSNEDGLEVVEYAVIVGIIVVASLTVLAAIGAWLLLTFQNFQTTVVA